MNCGVAYNNSKVLICEEDSTHKNHHRYKDFRWPRSKSDKRVNKMTQRVIAILVQDDEGNEQRIDLTSDDDIMQLDPLVQLRGILSAIRYLLGTPEGESVLQQCAKIVRQHKMSWPTFHGKVMESLNEPGRIEHIPDGRFGSPEQEANDLLARRADAKPGVDSGITSLRAAAGDERQQLVGDPNDRDISPVIKRSDKAGDTGDTRS